MASEAEIDNKEKCVQCGTANSWRLKLRGSGLIDVIGNGEDEESSCGHVVCIHCALIYITVKTIYTYHFHVLYVT